MDHNGRWVESQVPQQHQTSPQYPHHPYNAPPQQPLPQPYQPSPYSSYYSTPNPNPNPNPNPIPNPSPNPTPTPVYENPITAPPLLYASAASDTAAAVRPTVAESYLPNPYAPHGGYDGLHAEPYAYQNVAASYYYGGDAQGFQVTEAVCQYGLGSTGYRPVRKKVATFEDLETKKRKLIKGGTPTDSMRVCSLCNVVCNSEKVFASHLTGEKHLIQAGARPPNGLTPVAPNHVESTSGPRPSSKNTTRKALKMTTKVVQTAFCEVCKVDCNSQEVLSNHKLGRKHKKNLEKLQGPIMPQPPTTITPATITGVNETPADENGEALGEKTKKKVAPATKEDLEVKKRKVIEGGVAEDAVQVCTLCNVVCNSQTVFHHHIAGHKHNAMVKKQQPTTNLVEKELV